MGVFEKPDQNTVFYEVEKTFKKLKQGEAAGFIDVVTKYTKKERNTCGELLVGRLH